MAEVCPRAIASPRTTPEPPPEYGEPITPLVGVIVPETWAPSDGDRDCGLGACQAKGRDAGSCACRGVSERLWVGEEIDTCGVAQAAACEVPVVHTAGVTTGFCASACAHTGVCSLVTGAG